MSYDQATTVIGNLIADPELKFTNNGTAMLRLTVAVNRKGRDGAEDKVSFFDCSLFGKTAENAAQLSKGDRVMVFGELEQSRFERKDGSKGSAVGIKVFELGASTAFATVTVTR